MKKTKKISPDRSLTGSELFRLIEATCEGLMYVSETDAPVLPFVIEGDTTNDYSILEMVGAKADQAVEQGSLEAFFDRLTTRREWFGPTEVAMAFRFARLQQILKANLSDLKMVRIGTINLTLLIAGRDADGRLMGVRTKAVET